MPAFMDTIRALGYGGPYIPIEQLNSQEDLQQVARAIDQLRGTEKAGTPSPDEKAGYNIQ